MTIFCISINTDFVLQKMCMLRMTTVEKCYKYLNKRTLKRNIKKIRNLCKF